MAKPRFTRSVLAWFGRLALLLGFQATHAADYYVSPRGADGNLGSASAPWRTLQKAAATLQPGGVFADNGVWGIFSDYANDLVIEGNEVSGSKTQHGIYVSNSGDRPRLRRNIVHDNAQAGVQINADPALLRPDLGESGDGITTGAVRGPTRPRGLSGIAGRLRWFPRRPGCAQVRHPHPAIGCEK